MIDEAYLARANCLEFVILFRAVRTGTKSMQVS